MKKKCAGTLSKALRVMDVASQNTSKKSRSWYDKLKPEDKKTVDEIKSEFLTGNYPNLTAVSIARALSSEMGIEVSGQAMRLWLRKSV